MNTGVGFFGKLPSAGDFVQRRLPSAFVQSWDRHVQRAIDTGRRALGTQWNAAWRQGAAWRFVLPAQVCGSVAWCGLAGPAVDRLGRAFPMVLAAPCGVDVAAVLGNHAWFDALERVYRSALDEAVSVETFDVRVAALPGPLMHRHESMNGAAFWRDLPWDDGQWHLSMPEGAGAAMLLAEAWSQLGKRAGPWCLWWTAGAKELLATRGLPLSYAALLEPGGATEPAQPDAGVDVLCEFDATTLPGSGDEATVAASSGLQADPDFVAQTLTSVDSVAIASMPPPYRPPIDEGDSAPPVASATADAVVLFDEGRLLLLCADDAPPHASHAHRHAARAIRETVQGSATDLPEVRAALFALHARLRSVQRERDAHHAAHENGAALVARFDASQVRLLRIGAAAAWHWRNGELHPLFVERAAGAGGEFDDLLFGDAWLAMPGIGAADALDCDEACVSLEGGDRVLLLATRALTQLPHACLAEALTLATSEDVRLHLAMSAGLGAQPAQWPLAVIGVGA